MDNKLTEINLRREAIAQQIIDLQEEDKLWDIAYRKLYFRQHLLFASDKIEPRTAKKFAVLAVAVDEIEIQKQRKQSGATLQQIKRAIASVIRGFPENTLRSYLSRYRSEGRLSYLQSGAKWVLPRQQKDEVNGFD